MEIFYHIVVIVFISQSQCYKNSMERTECSDWKTLSTRLSLEQLCSNVKSNMGRWRGHMDKEA